jgi:uncharacterized protein
VADTLDSELEMCTLQFSGGAGTCLLGRFPLNAEKLKSLLNLVPLSIEGGFFNETYRSSEMISPECLPGRYGGTRNFGTCIYYLLEPSTFSEIHRVASDEIFHFYF